MNNWIYFDEMPEEFKTVVVLRMYDTDRWQDTAFLDCGKWHSADTGELLEDVVAWREITPLDSNYYYLYK